MRSANIIVKMSGYIHTSPSVNRKKMSEECIQERHASCFKIIVGEVPIISERQNVAGGSQSSIGSFAVEPHFVIQSFSLCVEPLWNAIAKFCSASIGAPPVEPLASMAKNLRALLKGVKTTSCSAGFSKNFQDAITDPRCSCVVGRVKNESSKCS
jgi:hypothetical protein